MTDDEEEQRPRRQIRREEQRDLGERSSKMAADFMKMSDAVLSKLDLDEDTRDAIVQARKVKHHTARRRAERQLAGDLRRLDIDVVEKKLAELYGSEDANAKRFHEAERWRARFVAEGTSAIAAFPGGGDDKLRDLIDAAQRSKPGSSKALFRYVVERLKAAGG